MNSYHKPLTELTWDQVTTEFTGLSIGDISMYEVGDNIEFLIGLVALLMPIVTETEWDFARGAS